VRTKPHAAKEATVSEEICYADATELARRVRAKEVSPVEVLNAHLERIEAVNPKINAIVTLVEDASDRAKAAETAVVRGEALGPLHGVPFTIKDGVNTAGVRTTCGSRLYRGNVPAADATVVARLKRAGGILIGKTNLPEFALSGRTDNALFGRTENPWMEGRTAGGSSGGEAAALAAGLSPLGIGSDVGGSVRSPAHFCSVVGLKATHGRVPLTGHWPDTLLRVMHVGPMARTVRDIALELSVIAGADGIDPYALPVPVPDAFDLDVPLSGIRVGWSSGRAFAPVEPEVAETVAKAAMALAEAGCDVEEVPLPGLDNRDVQTLCQTILDVEGAFWLEHIVAGHEDDLSPNIRSILALPPATLPQYLEALEEAEGLRRDTASYFHRYHLLLCPVKPLVAHLHDAAHLTIAGETVGVRETIRANVPWNFTGSPAVSVPFGWSSEGLPIGVQLVGRHFDEATVLGAAAALERVSAAATRHPM
jgi:aspartyl-tRNA(Asn)/glutamyl-tRNA(Gln) amidotransferase subunit A